MRRLVRDQSARAGLAPDAPVRTDQRETQKTQIQVMQYNGELILEKEADTVKECAVPSDRAGVTWVDVSGLREVETLEQLGTLFGLHPLVVEDILDTGQRPKVEDYDGYLFFVLKSLYHVEEGTQEPQIEQISLVLGPNYVLSFQEHAGDEFNSIRERMRSNGWRARKLSADYLTYALIDLIVDQYFVVLERLGDRIEELQEELIARPMTMTLQSIYHLKREMAYLRKSIWPLREVIAGLERMDSSLILGTTEIYLRDVYDHTIQIIEAVETSRDMLAGMLDIYLSSVSNRMNEVMKVLTVISTIFMPLTFIAGVYGMNFHHMPEIPWRWGYPITWVIMITIAGLMIAYFRRKKWF